jgi:hypothetical protein
MKLKQLSVFLENKPGRLNLVCKALADADINILTLTLADTEQFGILRFLVKDSKQAQAVLEKEGCAVNLSDVLAIEVPDRPGGLLGILNILEQNRINIEYMYAFPLRFGRNAIMILRFDDPDRAIAILQDNGVSVLREELFFASL